MVDIVDQQIGRVVTQLEADGELDNTVRVLILQGCSLLTMTKVHSVHVGQVRDIGHLAK